MSKDIDMFRLIKMAFIRLDITKVKKGQYLQLQTLYCPTNAHKL